MTPCSKCGTNLETGWKFCPHCSAACAPAAPPAAEPAQGEPKREKVPARYAFAGLMFGLMLAPVLIISGTLMCLMVGPWMAIGIPFIIAGLCAPFLGPYLAINAVRGKCPWCGAKITSVGPLDAFYCHACSQRIVVKDRVLVKAA